MSRWRYPKARRGRLFEAPRQVLAPQPPPFPPRTVRARIRLGTAARRARFAGPPVVAVAVPARATRNRLRLVAPRRGRFFGAPLAIQAQPAPAFPPRVVRGRVRLAAAHRGRSFSPPWPSQASLPPLWVPPVLLADRPRFPSSRRGRFAICPASAPAPARAGRRRIVPPVQRRGALVEPPWPQAVPPPPPAFVPQVRRGRPALPVRRVQGRHWPGWMELTISPEPQITRGHMTPGERSAATAGWQPRTSAGATGADKPAAAASWRYRPAPGATGTDRHGAEMEGT